MKMSSYTSKKLSIISLFMIFLVVLIHSFFTESESFPIAYSIARVLGGGGISRIAVPTFYVISGFLFFKNVTKVKDCFFGIKKRIRSLFVPFLIWNVFFVLWYAVLSSIPVIRDFVNSNISDYINLRNPFSCFLNLWVAPAGFHMWYLRDLIIVVFLAPVIYVLVKYLKWLAPLLLCFVYNGFYLYFASILEKIGIDIHQACSVAYFALGGCFALCSTEWVNRYNRNGICLAAGVFFLFDCIIRPNYNYIPLSINVLVILCGMIILWKAYDWCYNGLIRVNAKKLTHYSSYSFFIYLFHEPVFNIIKKIGLILLGVHEWSLIILYLVNPIIMCAIAIIVAKVLQKHLPKTYSILVGGR